MKPSVKVFSTENTFPPKVFSTENTFSANLFSAENTYRPQRYTKELELPNNSSAKIADTRNLFLFRDGSLLFLSPNVRGNRHSLLFFESRLLLGISIVILISNRRRGKYALRHLQNYFYIGRLVYSLFHKTTFYCFITFFPSMI